MKKLLFLTALMFGVGSVSAVQIPDSEGLEELKEQYNSQSGEVPSFVGSIVGGERVNFRLETNSTNETVGVAFEGKEISNISAEGFEDPTLKVWTEEETITTVLESQDKYSTLEQKLDENEIQYQATTTGSTVKVVIFDTIRGIVDMLGLEF